MRISFGESFDRGLEDITRASAELGRAQRLVSSGRRIQTVSDDPGGTVVAIGERATLSTVGSYERTSGGAKSRLGVADSVLSDMVNQLTAAKVTAAGAHNSARTPEQLRVYAAEIRGVAEGLFGDVNAKFGSTYLFSGTSAIQPYARVGNGYSGYAGNASTMSLDIASGRTVQVSFDAGNMLDAGAGQDIFGALDALATAIEAGDSAGIDTGMAAINQVFTQVVSAQTQVGVGQRTIEDVNAQLVAARLGGRERLAQVEDANMAEAISDLRQAEIAHEATLGSFASLARLTLMDFLK